MCVSTNAKGEVSRYFPIATEKSLKLPQGKGHLPEKGSLILDDSTGKEVFFFIHSENAFSFSQVKTWLTTKKPNRTFSIKTKEGQWNVQTLWVDKKKKSFLSVPQK